MTSLLKNKTYPSGELNIDDINGWENIGGRPWENIGGRPMGLWGVYPLISTVIGDEGYTGEAVQSYEMVIPDRKQPWLASVAASVIKAFRGEKSFMGLCAVEKPTSYMIAFNADSKAIVTGPGSTQTQLSVARVV
jgi:hypothetical protein